MSQSLASLHVHLVFSTKNRAAFLRQTVRPELHAYMGSILQKLECSPVLINSTEDHIHLLFALARTVPLARVVEDVKKYSSKWLKTKGPEFSEFSWQTGYGAFAVSSSNLAEVKAYIANQNEHHRVKSFQEEYRAFLERHGVAYDERYVWD